MSEVYVRIDAETDEVTAVYAVPQPQPDGTHPHEPEPVDSADPRVQAFLSRITGA